MTVQTLIRDRNGNMVDASQVALPTNRHFRSCWVKDPAAPVIHVDMDAARALYKERAEEATERFMREKLVPQLLDADMDNDDAARRKIRKIRRDGRQKRLEAAIDAAQTPEELEALWDEKLMGPPWWAETEV